MSNNRYRYGSSYRGRRTFHDFLMIIAILLAIVVVLALGVLFFGQRFLVFTDNGIRLEWPWKTEDGAAQDPLDPGSVSIVFSDESPAGSSSSEDNQPVPVVEPPTVAIELDVSQLVDGTATAAMQEAGANAIIVQMKDSEGQLFWNSGLNEANVAKVNNGTAGLSDAIRAFNAGDVYTIARVCAFEDNSMPYYYNSSALRIRGGNWRDDMGLRRMSPDSDVARNYLSGLCAEIAELGFDEIVLEKYGFPYAGNLRTIVRSYSFENDAYFETMAAVTAQIKSAIEPFGTKLSLVVQRGEITGEIANSGITPALIESQIDRVWMVQDDLEPALTDLLTTAGITEADTRLIQVVPAIEAGASSNQACVTLS